MNGPEILMDTVEALGARLDRLEPLLTRLTTDVGAAREEAAEVALGLGAAVGASILAHEESSAHTDQNVGNWLQSLDEQLSDVRGQLSHVRGELERLRGRVDDVERAAAYR